MSLQDRIESLKVKHATIEHALETKSSRPHPDDVELAELKKKKLAIKDEIVSISTH
ncbi:MAG: YdcH family protein [Rhodospirillales bacterium]|nr:YdcH family protein [Rhodospirillales bacterium]